MGSVQRALWRSLKNLTPNPFPRGKGNQSWETCSCFGGVEEF